MNDQKMVVKNIGDIGVGWLEPAPVLVLDDETMEFCLTRNVSAVYPRLDEIGGSYIVLRDGTELYSKKTSKELHEQLFPKLVEKES